MARPGSRFVQDEPEGVEREKKCTSLGHHGLRNILSDSFTFFHGIMN